MKRAYSILTILMCFVSSIFAEEYINNDTIRSLEEVNVGQGSDYVFNRLSSIFSYNDNGTNMSYTYYRMRGISCSMESVVPDR